MQSEIAGLQGQLTREEEESSLATPIRGAAEGNLPAGRPGWGRLRNLLQDARRDSPSSQNPSEKGPARAERPIEVRSTPTSQFAYVPDRRSREKNSFEILMCANIMPELEKLICVVSSHI